MAIESGKNMAYVKDLIKRYETAIRQIKKAEYPEEITKIEREIHPVVKEMQMAIPRVWDDLVIVSRDRRLEIRDSA